VNFVSDRKVIFKFDLRAWTRVRRQCDYEYACISTTPPPPRFSTLCQGLWPLESCVQTWAHTYVSTCTRQFLRSSSPILTFNTFFWRIKFTSETCKKSHSYILIMKATILDTHGSSSDCSNLGDFSPQGTERTTFTFYESLKRERERLFACERVCIYSYIKALQKAKFSKFWAFAKLETRFFPYSIFSVSCQNRIFRNSQN